MNGDRRVDRVLFCLWIFVICLSVYEMRDSAVHKPDYSHPSIVMP